MAIKKLFFAIFLLFLVSFNYYTLEEEQQQQSLAGTPRFVSYIDYINSWWPPATIAAGIGVPGYAQDTAYNTILFAFWTSNQGPVDIALIWSNPLQYFSSENPFGKTNPEIQNNLANLYHSKNIKILVSAFGATDYPTNTDPDFTCTKLANFVKDNKLDGVDLDYEDNAAMEQGIAEDWLIKCTKAIRRVLPVGQYILTHAPQAPYFMGTSHYPQNGYIKIHQQAGDLIDWYNMQFYNQESSTYDTYETLFLKANGWSAGTSVQELVQKGIPSNKIVIGKPATRGDAYNTGYTEPSLLASLISRAKTEVSWNAGVMAWQYKSDLTGAFINTVSKGFAVSNKDK